MKRRRVESGAFWIAALFVSTAVLAAEHPDIRDPDQADCASCHEEVMGGAVRHEAAEEDCLTCHEFSKDGDKLTVAVPSEMPGLCVDCHDEREAASTGSLAAPHEPVVGGCADCHDPHSSPNRALLTTRVPALCVDCHDEEELAKAHILPVSRSDCLRCHDPHGSDVTGMLRGSVEHEPFHKRSCGSCHRKGIGRRVRLVQSGAKLCFACHGDAKNAEGERPHPPFAEGLCIKCHAPHVSRNRKLLRSAENDLCLSCHDAIRRKVEAPVNHAVLDDGCTTCHDPHGSKNVPLLVSPVPELCLDCHEADDADLKAKHLMADLSEARCVTCHDPHGSTKPHLIATDSVHGPFDEGECDTCHDGRADKIEEDGESALCFGCHDEIEDLVKSAKVSHDALEVGSCIDCHTPHAAPRPKLLKGRAEEVCGECHDEQLSGAGESMHGAIARFGCPACHLPHGGENEKLLRVKDVNDLCLSCHDPERLQVDRKKGTATVMGKYELPLRAARAMARLRLSRDKTENHPIQGHRVRGKPTKAELGFAKSKYTDEIGCLTCHDPHKSKGKSLLRQTESGETLSCGTCHEK